MAAASTLIQANNDTRRGPLDAEEMRELEGYEALHRENKFRNLTIDMYLYALSVLTYSKCACSDNVSHDLDVLDDAYSLVFTEQPLASAVESPAAPPDIRPPSDVNAARSTPTPDFPSGSVRWDEFPSGSGDCPVYIASEHCQLPHLAPQSAPLSKASTSEHSSPLHRINTTAGRPPALTAKERQAALLP